jgi:hypothetical protein
MRIHQNQKLMEGKMENEKYGVKEYKAELTQG